MSRAHRRSVVLAAALALCAAAPALAAGPAKPPPPESGAGAQAEFARTMPGMSRLLVTFTDAPSRAVASARLAGLGSLAPVVPEAGVWGLSPADPSTARDRALARPQVSGAAWSLERRTADRPAPPDALGPAPAFTD